MNLTIDLVKITKYVGEGTDSCGTIYRMFINDLDSIIEDKRYGTYEYNDNIFGGYTSCNSNSNKEFDEEVIEYLKNNRYEYSNEPGDIVIGENIKYTRKTYAFNKDKQIIEIKVDMPK